MPYKLNEKQFASINQLSDEKRYDYFLRNVINWEEIWSLHSPDGWVELTVEGGQACLPVWPHPDFAAAWAIEEWSDCQPKVIKLGVWIERWTAGLESDDTVLAIFPVKEGEGMIVTPTELEKALLDEQ